MAVLLDGSCVYVSGIHHDEDPGLPQTLLIDHPKIGELSGPTGRIATLGSIAPWVQDPHEKSSTLPDEQGGIKLVPWERWLELSEAHFDFMVKLMGEIAEEGLPRHRLVVPESGTAIRGIRRNSTGVAPDHFVIPSVNALLSLALGPNRSWVFENPAAEDSFGAWFAFKRETRGRKTIFLPTMPAKRKPHKPRKTFVGKGQEYVRTQKTTADWLAEAEEEI